MVPPRWCSPDVLCPRDRDLFDLSLLNVNGEGGPNDTHPSREISSPIAGSAAMVRDIPLEFDTVPSMTTDQSC